MKAPKEQYANYVNQNVIINDMENWNQNYWSDCNSSFLYANGLSRNLELSIIEAVSVWDMMEYGL